MNKRKRTAHRRAALWPCRTAREVANAINAAVPSLGVVVPDDGLNFKRLFPDRWEELLDAHMAQKVPLTIVADDGTAQERFRADMARTREAGIVWHGSEGVGVTVMPLGAERGEDRA